MSGPFERVWTVDEVLRVGGEEGIRQGREKGDEEALALASWVGKVETASVHKRLSALHVKKGNVDYVVPVYLQVLQIPVRLSL